MTVNRLAEASSAYLKSAAHQPIHWHPWGEEAFAVARRDDKPILLDIGAVWCHWCHVMDGESYEDPGIAAFLNEHFVCIKVDRDERPDVDARYQRAVQTLTHQGGWPLTAFLTPDGEVFFGGTYFPPDGAYGRPGFRTVLASVLDAYRTRRGQVQAQAQAIRRVVDQSLDEGAAGEASPRLLEDAVAQMARVFDPVHGGFGSQPKFPHPGAIVFLLHRWHDQPSDQVRTIIDRTLEGMARGGVYDQLGGGFHRYSVDAEWIVPHFEKMAYDNSELLVAYAVAGSVLHAQESHLRQAKMGAIHSGAESSGPDFYLHLAQDVVRWVREVLADPDGGYAASQDADVGLDDDGDYFTWTRDEAAAVLTPDELDVAAAYYDIGTAGEMHHNPGKNVLYVATTLATIARIRGEDEATAARLLESAREKLQAARAERTAPFVDRTRYTNWNAMMASALLRAGAVLADGWARDHALLTLERIRRESGEPDAVAHTPGGITGLLDDQVHTAAAALDAFEATGEGRWLEWAVRLMDRVWADYRDPEAGGLFDRPRETGGLGLLPAPAKPVQDTPTPSPNGTAGITLMRLHELTGEAVWRERAGELVRAFAGQAAELGLHGATYLLALDWYLNPATHVVIVGERDEPAAARMHEAALRAGVPRRVVQWLAPGDVGRRPLPAPLAAMVQAAGGPRAYVCTGTSCQAPVSTVDALETTLANTLAVEQR